MEIIDSKPSCSTSRPYLLRRSNLFLGVVLILSGILWMLHNLTMISPRFFHFCFSGPMLLSLLGGYLLLLRYWVAGSILTIFGVGLLILRELHLTIPFHQLFWPLVIVALGIGFLCRNLKR